MIGDAVDVLDVTSSASLKHFYAAVDKVVRIAVNQRVASFDIAFAAGLFAKTDYLVKQLDINKDVAKDFNEVRDRIKHLDTVDDLGQLWSYDLKAMVCFISAIYDCAPIPDSIARLLPVASRHRERTKLMAKKMRVAVESVDGQTIHAVVESTSTLR